MLADPAQAIAAILGVLRAGAFYIYLDPDSPEGRLREIVEDGAVTMILAGPELSATARAVASVDMPVMVCQPYDGPAEAPPPVAVDPQDIAYIAYTSGSTGAPKGVMHQHANVLHEAEVHRTTLDRQPDDRSTLLYSPGVTGCVRDLFTTLLTGGQLCPFPLRKRGFTELKMWLRDQGVTQFHSVPSVFRELIRVMEPDERLESVRTVFVAGERVLPEDVRQFHRHFSPSARFYTGIGATETSSIYTHWFVDGDGPWPDGRLPSGWPVPQKEVRLVGEERQPVGPGEPGEIAVCSHYLAKGYWRRPSLDRLGFGETSDGSGRRVYYTGDFGHFDEQGRLVHLGRRDRQVKINGHRVEPGEIENALRQHPGITAAAVRVLSNNGTRPRIVAYVVSPGGFVENELRAKLSQCLESAALPEMIVPLDALPLSGSGKVDYQALPAPDFTSRAQTPDVPPAAWSAAERQVLAVWQVIFPGLPMYRRTDTFGNLGGDSLRALRLAELLSRRLQVELPVGPLLRDETIATIALRVNAAPQALPETESVEDQFDEMLSLAALWRLPESGRQISDRCPVFVAGEGRPGVPLLWFGYEQTFEIGLAISKHRPVFLIPSTAASGAEAMDQVCRELARRMAPYLPKRITCGGCCYSGLQAMLLSRALTAQGFQVNTVFLLDTFGSTRSRLLVTAVFMMQEALQRGKAFFLNRGILTRLRRFLQLWNRPAGATNGARTKETYLIDFVPFGYEGRMVHILSGRTAWTKWFLPRLGWGSVEHSRAQIHTVPGDHTSMWNHPGILQVESILENEMASADSAQSAAPAAVAGTALETISDTARWVAVYRAWETHRPDAIFCDPLAERLAGQRGEQIVRELGAAWMASSIVVRTAAIDSFVQEAVADGVDTVLNLAAGLDTRPYRMELPAKLHWIEVDLPAILKYKEEALAGETPRCRLTRIAQDVSETERRRSLLNSIAAQGRKILVITEGLLVYIPEAEVQVLATDLASQNAFVYWAQDFVSPDVLASLNKNWGTLLGQAEASMVFAPAEGAEYYRPHGWMPKSVRYFAEEAQRLNRNGHSPSSEEPRKDDSGYALLERSFQNQTSGEQKASTYAAGVR
jgi:methyltransferase (TIGR00027 family)